MSDWNLPTLSDLYSNFLDSLKARDLDAITLGLNTIANPQPGMMRYVRASNIFQEYDGTNWINKVISVAGGGTGVTTPAGIVGILNLGTMSNQNANNVSIVGGSVSGLGYLQNNGAFSQGGATDMYAGLSIHNGILAINGNIQANTSITAGTTITAQGNISSAAQVSGLDLVSSRNILGDQGLVRGLDVVALRNASVVGNLAAGSFNTNAISGTTLTLTGNLACARLDASQLMITYTDCYARGVFRAGPSDVPITNGADGTLLAARIGYGYTGSGTRVLFDNNTWGEAPGMFLATMNQDVSFGSQEEIKNLDISSLGVTNPNQIMVLRYGPDHQLSSGEHLGVQQLQISVDRPTNNSYITIRKSTLNGSNVVQDLLPSTHSFFIGRVKVG